ncbi:MAG: SNF2-related protein [Candidatus Solibacter sp.]|nr:SNF2-related protein [Candidatus Solibacter sp.]
MPLASKIAFQFERRLQFKGLNLFHGNAVRVTHANQSMFSGDVMGGNRYSVRLTYNEGVLAIYCECPYFADTGRCKHLWAAVLEADKRGVLGEAQKAASLRLVRDAEAEDRPQNSGASRPSMAQPPRTPPWQEYFADIRQSLEVKRARTGSWPKDFEIVYVIDVVASRTAGAIVLELHSRSRKKNGEWTVLKEFRIVPAQVSTVPDPVDAEVLAAILGGQEYYLYSYGSTSGGTTRKAIPYPLAQRVIPMLAATGRLFFRDGMREPQPVIWEADAPWKLWLKVRQDERDQWNITGSLRRAEEQLELQEPLLLVEGGFVLAKNRLAPLDDGGVFPWITRLTTLKRIPFPDRDRDTVMGKLLELTVVPPLDVDEALKFEERRVLPRIGLRVTQQRETWGEEYFQAHLLFDYGRGWSEPAPSGRGIWLPEERVYLVRDAEAESAAQEKLKDLGLRPSQSGGAMRLPAKLMPRVVRELLHAGWHVEAEGKAFRRPGTTKVDVRSGIDWFELYGEVDYDGQTASLPALLAALRRGDTMVRLGDGTFGLLPEEWLERFAPLAGLGTKEEDHLRFRRNQAGLLDALLAAQPEVHVDELFERMRERLRTFQGVKTAVQPPGFVGTLRDYQCEGLGWMEFLREFGFGGCLADDMGVGKTAQVLATLEARRVEGKGPSLVVAPKSLMFNWRAEAARFTPELRVLEHTGLARDTALIPEHDLVLTTYGTMLRDITSLAQIEFDYVVLDEAQAVKNSNTASAKAVRLLRGKHRLALSGTPVENHLGELWSLFEFLNPGMLGEAKVLNMAGGLARNPGEDARKLLSQALRPFILRRTKQQVARELPEKTEQTIFCELEGPQRKHYDELRKHYRETLLTRVQTQGMGKSKMHVLEALLRLRQAACHPGLLDSTRIHEPSAKLDVLMDQLAELREEGHKALVFSQFTSLLAIVRDRLDSAGIRYEYLDGATRNREEHVAAFQNDPDCGLFLISLKAGGLGLNLTAAEYVFLLDPWWNPAVEAQAVDRAHRIGQTRPVFAYRLIARDTVEEKVLELQKTKRELADAILGEDNSVIRDLKREDLEMLLS